MTYRVYIIFFLYTLTATITPINRSARNAAYIMSGCALLATVQTIVQNVLWLQCEEKELYLPLLAQYYAPDGRERGPFSEGDMGDDPYETELGNVIYDGIPLWGAPDKPMFPFLLHYTHTRGLLHALAWSITGDQLFFNGIKGVLAGLCIVAVLYKNNRLHSSSPHEILKRTAKNMLYCQLPVMGCALLKKEWIEPLSDTVELLKLGLFWMGNSASLLEATAATCISLMREQKQNIDYKNI